MRQYPFLLALARPIIRGPDGGRAYVSSCLANLLFYQRPPCIEALEIFRAQPKRYDLVITDMTMPHMTGEVFVKELLAVRPDIPIILCTGFNEMISEERAKAIGIREFAMKPLRIRDLAKIIEKVLH